MYKVSICFTLTAFTLCFLASWEGLKLWCFLIILFVEGLKSYITADIHFLCNSNFKKAVYIASLKVHLSDCCNRKHLRCHIPPTLGCRLLPAWMNAMVRVTHKTTNTMLCYLLHQIPDDSNGAHSGTGGSLQQRPNYRSPRARLHTIFMA